MFLLTLRQARSTAGRLLLAGVAVALGTGFVAAVLLTSALFTRTISDSVAAQYAGANVIVHANGAPLSDADVELLTGTPGIAVAEGRVDAGVQLVGADGTEYTTLRNTATAPALAAADQGQLAEGVLPTATGQVALSASTAKRLGVELGGTVAVRIYPPAVPSSASSSGSSSAEQSSGDQAPVDTGDADGSTTQDPAPIDTTVTVVGLLHDPTGVFLADGPVTLATTPDALRWSSDQYGDLPPGSPRSGFGTVLVAEAPGASPEQARDAAARRLSAAGMSVQTGGWDPSQGWTGDAPPVDVLTKEQMVDRSVDSALDGTHILTSVVLAFAAVALFVATTVITNTFSVLVAQRTRQLALLRCVGATKGQVRRSVLLEAAALGLVASAAGVVAGTCLAAIAALVLKHFAPDVPVPRGVVLTPVAVLAPLAVGTGATVLAALAPARAATRVSPLAALRPEAAPDLRTRTSRWRLALSLVLLVGGGALLVLGTLFAAGAFSESAGLQGTGQELSVYGVAAAVLGGMASFTGVLVGQVFLVPRTVALVGRLVSRAGGAPARLAALNAVRNPRRTASTAGALLIGTTLVSLMVVGAATTSRTLNAALDRQYPVDVEVSSVMPGFGESRGMSTAVLQGASAAPGLGASAPVLTAQLAIAPGTDGGGADAPSGSIVDSVAATREQFQSVLSDPSTVAPLQRGTVVVPFDIARQLGLGDGAPVTVRPTISESTTSADGTMVSGFTSPDTKAPGLPMRIAVSQVGGRAVLVVPDDLRSLDPAAPTGALWMRLAPGADPVEVSDEVQTAVTKATGDDSQNAPVYVSGLAAQRASYERVIDTMLLVVVGLLAVAVIIALIGVANTLSLSVIERTRENAVLRALGLTRGQLRRMLAFEGALVAGVGGLLGVVLGSVYGWAGAASLLGGAASAGGSAIWTPSLPWDQLGLLLAVAVVAGLLASVLPARRAVRTPPVAALADQ